jgi:hypothetical protein
MFLPILSRDMNIMRQNLSKFVKVMTSQSETIPDSYFKSSDEMEAEFERKFSRIKTKKTGNLKEPEKEKAEGGSGFLSKIATILSSLVSGIVTIVKAVIVSLSAVVKALITTLISAITPLVSAAFKTLISGVTKMLIGVGKALLAAFKIKDLLPFILKSLFLRNPALAGSIVLAGLLYMGLKTLAKDYVEGKKASDRLRFLNNKIEEGTADDTEIAEALALREAGAKESFGKKAINRTIGKQYQLSYVEGMLDGNFSDDDIKMAFGVQREVLEAYREALLNKDLYVKSGLAVPTLETIASSFGEKIDRSTPARVSTANPVPTSFPEESGAGPNLGRLDKSGQSFTPASAAIENLLFGQPDRDFGPELDSTSMLKSDRVLSATQQNAYVKQNVNEGQTSILPTITVHSDGRVTMGNQNKSKIPGVVNVDFPESVQLGSWEFQ